MKTVLSLHFVALAFVAILSPAWASAADDSASAAVASDDFSTRRNGIHIVINTDGSGFREIRKNGKLISHLNFAAGTNMGLSVADPNVALKYHHTKSALPAGVEDLLLNGHNSEHSPESFATDQARNTKTGKIPNDRRSPVAQQAHPAQGTDQ